jgi:hypothetical protein
MTDKQKAAAKGIDFKTMNVYQKIGWVQANMTTVKKTGWNNFQSYPYATDADIMNAVRPLLASLMKRWLSMVGTRSLMGYSLLLI